MRFRAYFFTYGAFSEAEWQRAWTGANPVRAKPDGGETRWRRNRAGTTPAGANPTRTSCGIRGHVYTPKPAGAGSVGFHGVHTGGEMLNPGGPTARRRRLLKRGCSWGTSNPSGSTSRGQSTLKVDIQYGKH